MPSTTTTPHRPATAGDGDHYGRNTGLACPGCGGQKLPVAYTRQRPGHVLRVRACPGCGRRVVTRERLDR